MTLDRFEEDDYFQRIKDDVLKEALKEYLRRGYILRSRQGRI